MRAGSGKHPGRRARSGLHRSMGRRVAEAGLICVFLFASACGVHSPPTVPMEEVPALSDQAEAAYYYLTYRDRMHKGEAAAALDALQEALKRDASPELYLELASQYWRRDAFPKVEALLKSALDKFPGHRSLSLTLSRFYVDQEQTHKALAVLDAYVANHPQDMLGLRHLARVYLKMRDYEQSRAVLKSIPNDEWTADEHYLMAQIASAQDKRQATIRHLKAATRMNPTFVKAWAELGYQYEMTKDYAAAEAAYTELLELDTSNQEIYIRLIELNLKLNNPEKALALVHRAPRKERFLLRAVALFLQNDLYTFADRLFAQFGGWIADHPEGKLYQALTVYKAAHDIDGALQILDSIPSDQNIYDQVLTLKARLLWQQGKSNQALEQVRSAQGHFPEQERFWLLESDILRDQGQTKQALDVLRQARERFPEAIPVLFQAGVLEHELGRRQEAIDLMERILTLDPEHAGAMNFIGYSLVEEQEELQRAYTLISKALDHDPNNGYYLDSLAWYYYQTGDLDKAWSTIEAAVAEAEDDPVIWEHYAEIALSLKKMKKAAEGYRKALKLGSANRKELERKLLEL